MGSIAPSHPISSPNRRGFFGESSDPSLTSCLEEWLDGLPCMAFLERDDEIFAANGLARDFVQTADALPLHRVFLGAYPPPGDERRQRFECLLLSTERAPTQIVGAVQPFPPAGPASRLILVMDLLENFPASPSNSNAAVGHTYLQDLFDDAPEAMVILQVDTIFQANREFIRMFGYSLDQCLGANVYDLIVPEGRQYEREMMHHTVSCEGRSYMETVRRTRAGAELEVSITVIPVRLGAGVSGLSVTYRDIGPQKQAEARLQHNALHDPLTGLANRVLFLDRLNLTMARLGRRPDRNFAVVFLDVDRFKHVNDTHGHAAGDSVLLAVTERLRRCLRPQDTVARFGGDEFALLIDDIRGTEEIARTAHRIQDELQRPIDIGGQDAFVSASMGIALGSAEYTNADDIMHHADLAMYVAKANGKARHEFFALQTATTTVLGTSSTSPGHRKAA